MYPHRAVKQNVRVLSAKRFKKLAGGQQNDTTGSCIILHAVGNEPGERRGVSLMALTLILDSLTRSVSEGIFGKNKQPKPLADASGYKVSAIGRKPSGTSFLYRQADACRSPIVSLMTVRSINCDRTLTRMNRSHIDLRASALHLSLNPETH